MCQETKIVRFGMESRLTNSESCINGEKLEQINEFVYVGIKFTKDWDGEMLRYAKLEEKQR